MIKSMTGYGRALQTVDGYDILVEMKSVNHRYLEFTARVPRAYSYLEEKLKSFLQQKAGRGKVEVSVSIYAVDGTDAQVEVNRTLLKGYVDALRSAGKELGLTDDLTLSAASRFGDIFNVRKAVEDADEIWGRVLPVAEEALDGFLAMREAEGKQLKADIQSRLEIIGQFVSQVEERSPQTVEEYRARLTKKMQEVLGDSSIDEARILTEAAIYADRIAVDEETVRLRSHLAQIGEMLDSGEAVGRKLDFIVQELNRETNTIGSKAQDLEIARIVVEMKAQIEKIREQVQNIE